MSDSEDFILAAAQLDEAFWFAAKPSEGVYISGVRQKRAEIVDYGGSQGTVECGESKAGFDQVPSSFRVGVALEVD